MARGTIAAAQHALTFSKVLEEELEFFRDSNGDASDNSPDEAAARPDGETQVDARDEAERLAGVNARAHQKCLAALCLSGGGIRSASFSLGVLQGLARRGLLSQFDYLSTVSGGGYTGSWLSAWINRDENGMDGVQKALAGNRLPAKSSRAAEPEPVQVRHLREYTNYLAPRLGLFSLDAWTLVATYVRNLLLNWLVLVPMIALVLLLPHLLVALIQVAPGGLDSSWYTATLGCVMLAGIVLATVSMAAAVLFLPSLDRARSRGGRPLPEAHVTPKRRLGRPSSAEVSVWIIAPMVAAATLLTGCLYCHRDDSTVWWEVLRRLSAWHRLAPYAALATFPLAGVVTYLLARSRGKPNPPPLPKLLGAFTILGVAVLSAVLGLQAVMARWHPESVACFGVPALLTVFLGLVTIYVGLTSRDPSPAADDDREWWGRLMGTVSRVVFTWLALTCLCLYGPRMVAWLWRLRDAGSVGPALLAVLSALSAAAGAAGIFGGYGTSSGEQPTDTRVTRWRRIAKALPAVGARIFVFALLLALGTVIYQGSGLLRVYFELERKGSHYLLPGIGSRANSVGGDPLQYLGVVGVIVAEAGLVVVLAGRLISVNRLSLHAMYRTRLIRTFLGASNPKRRADQFTGFDPADNIPMHHLRRNQLFRASDIVPKGSNDYARVAQLLELWRGDSSSFGQYLRDRLDADVRTRDLLAVTQSDTKWSDPTWAQSITEKALRHLNNLVCDVNLAARSPYAEWLEEEPAGRVRQPCDRQELEIFDACRQLANDCRPHLLNRLILEKHCVDTRGAQSKPLLGRCRPRPLHVVNLALNLVRGSNLAWQHRKAGSFTVSPLHSGFMPQPEGCGEERIVRGGYRPSALYGRGITLGTAMAISGAAASPNMGYHSSPAVAFLLTLINARLGWWLGNPAEIPPDSDWKRFKAWLGRFPSGKERNPDRRTWALPHPRHQLSPVINELLSRTSDSCEYVYLSDGGHFENLGLYEMVRRRCRTIVVVDATCDPNCCFADLGGAIRKIRADLGVPIHMEDVRFHKAFTPDKGKFCAVGTIHYSAVDGWQPPDGRGVNEGNNEGKKEGKKNKNEGKWEGTIVYIKAAIREHLPIEVYNYSRTSETFPHEPTTDQWFSESQFESYRRLGEACVDRICLDGNAAPGDLTLKEFVSCAEAHAKTEEARHPSADKKVAAAADSGGDGASREQAPAGQPEPAAKPQSPRAGVGETAPPSRPPAAVTPGLSRRRAREMLEGPSGPHSGGPASSAPPESADQPPPEVKSNRHEPVPSRETKPAKGKKSRHR